MVLLANGDRNLSGGGGPRLIVADKAPLKNGDRPGEHSFHWPLGLRLRKGGPAYGHGLRPFHVTEKDGRLDATRAVALDPTVFGENETAQLLPEILDHVGALKFAMNENIETNLILPTNDPCRFLFQKCFVVGFGDFALAVVSPRCPHLFRLRKRANGGRRQIRKL